MWMALLWSTSRLTTSLVRINDLTWLAATNCNLSMILNDRLLTSKSTKSAVIELAKTVKLSRSKYLDKQHWARSFSFMLILSSNIEYRVHKHITYLYGRRSYPGTVRDRYLNGLVWVCGANRPLLGQSVDIMLQPTSFDFGTTDSDRFCLKLKWPPWKLLLKNVWKRHLDLSGHGQRWYKSRVLHCPSFFVKNLSCKLRIDFVDQDHYPRPSSLPFFFTNCPKKVSSQDR